jgi:hypothetical protein
LYANGIFKAISLHTKVLLLFSQAGAQTTSVNNEMETLLSRTIDEHADLLYPLWLDDAMTQATIPWAKRLRENPHSCDFTNWQYEDSYQQHFDELLRRLKVKPT